MTYPNEPLTVDPARLQLAADRIDGHASDFRSAREAASTRAGSTALGSGSAAAALPEMLSAWESDGMRFDEHFTRHAHGHRTAAPAYARADADGANGIDDAGAGF